MPLRKGTKALYGTQGARDEIDGRRRKNTAIDSAKRSVIRADDAYNKVPKQTASMRSDPDKSRAISDAGKARRKAMGDLDKAENRSVSDYAADEREYRAAMKAMEGMGAGKLKYASGGMARGVGCATKGYGKAMKGK